jgi:hypothetical protein
MKKIMGSAFVALAMIGVGYSGHAQAKPATPTAIHWKTDPLQDAQKVDFKSLPFGVRKAAREQFGNKTRVEDVDKGMLGGKVVYEIAYKKDPKSNKTSELRITADGKVLGEHSD